MPQDAAVATAQGHILAADGVPLKAKLRQANRRRRLRAMALVVPLFLFILVSFLLPIGDMLFRSVDNPTVAEFLPRTVDQLEKWDGKGIPGEFAFEALVKEMELLKFGQSVGKLGSRLNFERGGMRSLISKTGRKAGKVQHGPYKEALIKIDKRWADRETWATIKLIGARYTPVQYLAGVDRRIDANGDVVMQPEVRQIYTILWLRTLWISLAVTVFCLLLGYPISYLLATLPLRTSNLLMIMVLLPFWTSLLVRTTSWIVLLQSHGVINDLLVWMHIISDEGRIRMIYNWIGTLIAMTQILLPFMVLPLYSVMKTVPPTYMRAAQSMGATPAWSFYKVYLPQTVPGIGAGCLLVFILSIGYYITPALVGGEDGQLISNFIAYHMKKSLNWGLAAALGTTLLAAVLVLYWVYNKIVGIDNMKLG
jgi:putative spermidine/putrescine transport system permease protein